MKKFLLLGGKPIGSMDILNYAKAQGYHVTVCDYLSVSESPCKQLADECWDISTADVDTIVEKAKANNIDAVFTGVHEFNIACCAEVCEKLNLPCYVTPAMWKKVSNKQYYKAVWKQYGIDIIPEFRININDIDENIEYPILLKPVDGSGARGIAICNSAQDVQTKITQTLKFSKSGVFIAEKYLTNKDEITIVYIIQNGIPYLASLADRIVYEFDKDHIPLPIGYVWTSRYLKLYQRTCDEKMKSALRSMEIKNGMIFIQAIVKDERIYPYDMGYRISGTQEHIILEKMSGYNPLKLLTDYAFGNGFGDEALIEKINPEFAKPAAQVTFLGLTGTIHKFYGVEETEKLPNVLRVVKNHSEGEVISSESMGTLNRVLLRVFMQALDKKSLYELIKLILCKINVISDKDTRIVLKPDSDLFSFYIFGGECRH